MLRKFKSKYTPKIIEAILETIRKTGVERDGCKSAGVGESTYYLWKSEKPEFVEMVEEALGDYRKSQAYEIELGRAYLLRTLRGEEKLIKSRTLQKRDGSGTQYGEDLEVTELDVKPPNWYLLKLYEMADESQKKDIRITIGLATPAELEPENLDDQQEYDLFDE